MPVPLLRLYDGFAHTSPDLRGVGARPAGGAAALRPRGRRSMACSTAAPSRRYAPSSAAQGLPADGVVGPATWQALTEPEPPAALDRFTTSYPLDDPLLLDDLHAAARYGASIVAAAAGFGLPPAMIVGARLARVALGPGADAQGAGRHQRLRAAAVHPSAPARSRCRPTVAASGAA